MFARDNFLVLFLIQKINENKSCGLSINIPVDTIFVKSKHCLTGWESFIMKLYWDRYCCFEFFCKFMYSFSVFWHRSIDIVGHANNDYLYFTILYPFGKYIKEIFGEYGFPCKTKSLYGVGKTRFSGTIVYGDIIIVLFHFLTN